MEVYFRFVFLFIVGYGFLFYVFVGILIHACWFRVVKIKVFKGVLSKFMVALRVHS